MALQRVKGEHPGIILRLPVDLREAMTEESRIKGDLWRGFFFSPWHMSIRMKSRSKQTIEGRPPADRNRQLLTCRNRSKAR